MNFKSSKAVFFILIFLTSKVGLALNIHYCGGHIAEITLAWNVEGCGMPLEKNQHESTDFSVKKNHCCQDQSIFIQNNEPHKSTDSEFHFFPFLTPKNRFNKSTILELSFQQSFYIRPQPVIPKNKIFLIYQSLVFYG